MHSTPTLGFNQWCVVVNAVTFIVFERSLNEVARHIPEGALAQAHARGVPATVFVETEVAEAMGVAGGLAGLD